ncbi:hypothetical protein HBP99_13805 [Listeria booriae]|uniref:hypothetical protein n=1 Tax=Listeria booriae TaxID=1552123 RepID=UPI001628E8E8|nr:hypothetical protein [Listeria booriae]MBC2369717.1 hypothetical protein [Listeria booriae]
MGRTYFIKRKDILDLNGAIFEVLRDKLDYWSKIGRAIEVTNEKDGELVRRLEQDRNYIKYYC